MGIGFGTGLAAFMGGLEKGQDRRSTRERQQREDAFYSEKQARQQKEWARNDKDIATEEAIKAESKAIPLTREGPVLNPNRATELPMTDDSDVAGAPASAAQLPATRQTQRFDSELLRDQAGILAKHGKLPESLKFSDEARQREMQRSARLFSQVHAGANGQDVKGLIDQSIKVFNDDPGLANLENVRYDDKGGVSFEVVNKQTQQRVSKNFADPKQLLNDLHAYYSPESWDKQESARRASDTKMAEENNKVHIIPAGGTLAKNSGKELLTNDNGYIQDGNNADGTPRLIKAGGRAGSAAAPDVHKLSNDAWELANKGEAKLDPATLLSGARLTQELVVNGQGKVSPALAAEVSLKVITDPKAVEPSMDLLTGDVDSVYEHPTHGSFKIGAKVASAADSGKFTPEQMQGMTARFLSRMPAADQASLVAAAFDPKAQATLMSGINAEIDKAAAARIQANPQQAAAIKAQAEDTKRATAESVGKKLGLVSKYGKPPAASNDKTRLPKKDYGLGSYAPRPGTPTALADRMRSTQQAAEKEAAKTLAASAASAAKIKADADKNKEADWMTLPAISKMSPDEARKYLRAYPTLDRKLRDALSKQMQSEDLYQLPDGANNFL